METSYNNSVLIVAASEFPLLDIKKRDPPSEYSLVKVDEITEISDFNVPISPKPPTFNTSSF